MEKPLTSDEWEDLRILANREAMRLEEQNYPAALIARYDAMAEKCSSNAIATLRKTS